MGSIYIYIYNWGVINGIYKDLFNEVLEYTRDYFTERWVLHNGITY